MSRIPLHIGVAVLGLALGAAAPAQDARSPAPARAPDEPLLAHLERAFEAAADRIAPSVLAIEVERDASTPERLEEGAPAYTKRPGGQVTGIVIGPGRVLTSAYNIEGAKRISVVGPGGRRLEAKVVGHDDGVDLALLAVAPGAEADATDARALSVATFVDGRGPRVGSWLVVVGRGPAGEVGINSGIVSAISRMKGEAIQTDAALNYGNFGGAAVDIDGRLVGIAVRLAPRAGVNSGVGFIVPAAKVREVLPYLERGEVRRGAPHGFLGVRFGREMFEPPGVEVADVVPGSAAADAGLQKGDILRRVADVEALDLTVVSDTIQAHRPGDQIRLEVERDGHRVGFEAKLGERPTAER